DVECDRLTSLISSINVFIAKHIQRLFKHPISMMLSLYKTIKSTGIDKPQVNFTINYRDGVLSDIKSLSGGEKERISLLLTLAVSRVCGNNLFMLDESLVNLDKISKRACNSLIRDIAPDTITLLVSHETYEEALKSNIDELGIYERDKQVKPLYDEIINFE